MRTLIITALLEPQALGTQAQPAARCSALLA